MNSLEYKAKTPNRFFTDNTVYFMNILLILVFIIICILFCLVYKKALCLKRQKRIDTYEFPNSIIAKVIETYPHLTEEQALIVIQRLREYFHLCNLADKSLLAMPSQAVDVAWHEFILFTKNY